MIKNERQYRITKAQANKFQLGLEDISRARKTQTSKAWLLDLQEDAIKSQLSDLMAELSEYEALQSQNLGIIKVDSFDELPIALIKARIASGLSQKALAARMGIKEQQIQRYEVTEYARASLSRLKEVVNALCLDVKEEIFLSAPPVSVSAIYTRLNKIGLNHSFVQNRLLPKRIREAISQLNGESEETSQVLVMQVASWIGKIFNWTQDDILGTKPLIPQPSIVLSTQFRRPTRADEQQVDIYAVYAHYLALLTLQCSSPKPNHDLSCDTSTVREEILKQFGKIDLESVLTFIWECGIPILPLRDPGKFYGACWRVQGRNVIVLKQRTSSSARWMIDALHEFYHTLQEPQTADLGVIEQQEILVEPIRVFAEEERNATWFAVNVVLNGHAEDMVQECITEAQGQVEFLKKTVPRVAERYGVSIGVLANYLAYRLSMQEINWWGTAHNLQSNDSDPWLIARNIFLQKTNISQLDEGNQDMIMQALSEEV